MTRHRNNDIKTTSLALKWQRNSAIEKAAAKKRKRAPKKGYNPHGPHYIAQVVSGPDAGTFKAKCIQDGTSKRNRLPGELEVYVPTTFRKPLEIGDLVFVRAHGRKPKKSAPDVDFRVVKAVGVGGYGEHYDFGWQASKSGAPAKPQEK
ncbi:hypothetical protein ACIBL5_14350 [Streptomyces sp. NPDC050516]|uniref:hypothetical protein n=1 Tax=Streptomyces sp. NPDC050516 TaxID=3365621 RepID=UPI0037BDD971